MCMFPLLSHPPLLCLLSCLGSLGRLGIRTVACLVACLVACPVACLPACLCVFMSRSCHHHLHLLRHKSPRRICLAPPLRPPQKKTLRRLREVPEFEQHSRCGREHSEGVSCDLALRIALPPAPLPLTYSLHPVRCLALGHHCIQENSNNNTPLMALWNSVLAIAKTVVGTPFLNPVLQSLSVASLWFDSLMLQDTQETGDLGSCNRTIS